VRTVAEWSWYLNSSCHGPGRRAAAYPRAGERLRLSASRDHDNLLTILVGSRRQAGDGDNFSWQSPGVGPTRAWVIDMVYSNLVRHRDGRWWGFTGERLVIGPAGLPGHQAGTSWWPAGPLVQLWPAGPLVQLRRPYGASYGV
jgi:hypothetical protein